MEKIIEVVKLYIKKIIPLNLYIYLQKKKRRKQVKKLLERINFKALNIDEFYQKKKSDTVFILGSGESINTLTNEEWKIIEKNDSIGLNFWLYHKFIPNFYCYEESRDVVRNRIFYQNLNLKEKDYRNTTFIIKSIENGVSLDNIPISLVKNFRVSEEIIALCYSKNIFNKFTEKVNNQKILFQARASISYLIWLSYLMGYANVVLCGIDLDSTGYFFEIDKYKKFTIPKNEMKNIHFTEEKLIDKIFISEIIEELSNFLSTRGVNLFIAKNTGKLKNILPTFNFKGEKNEY